MLRSDLATVRVRKDVNELSKAKYTCSHARTRVDFPDGMNNMLRLNLYISIEDNAGPYANGDFTFSVEIPQTYPFHPPTVTCLTPTWHPNIDTVTGRVMVSLLGKDWRPVLSINTVLFALQLIFVEPGLDFVLNPLAAKQLQTEPKQFTLLIQELLCGGTYFGYDFPQHIRQHEKRKKLASTQLKRVREVDLDYEPVHDALARCEIGESMMDDIDSIAQSEDSIVKRWKRMRLNQS